MIKKRNKKNNNSCIINKLIRNDKNILKQFKNVDGFTKNEFQ